MDVNVFHFTIAEYYGNANSLTATTSIVRDKINYKSKTIIVEYIKDPYSDKAISDTTIMLFINNGNNKYREIERRQGTRIL